VREKLEQGTGHRGSLMPCHASVMLQKNIRKLTNANTDSECLLGFNATIHGVFMVLGFPAILLTGNNNLDKTVQLYRKTKH